MWKQAIFFSVIFSSIASAKPSCLFEGEYPTRLGAEAKERVDYVRGQMKALATLTKMRSRATLVQSLVDWLPQGCEAEFLEYLETKIFEAKPVRFNPELAGRIAAVGKVPDYVWSMPLKSRILLKLYRLPESDLTAWEDDGDRGGPTVLPQPSAVKGWAARELVRSNLVLNDEDYREFLEKEILPLKDYQLRHVFQPSFERLLHFKKDVLLKAWTAELPELLQVKSTNVYPYWMALKLVEALGEHGATEAKPLLQEIVDRKGKYPLTEQVHNGQRDLYAEAAKALARLL